MVSEDYRGVSSFHLWCWRVLWGEEGLARVLRVLAVVGLNCCKRVLWVEIWGLEVIVC